MLNSLVFFIVLPGLISILILTNSWFIGRFGSFVLAIIGLFITFFFFYLVFVKYTIVGVIFFYKYTFWVKIGFFTVPWGFLFDGLSVIMLLVVSLISLLVHIYSVDYMYNDPHSSRFMAFLSLFTFFMYILVSANNLFQLFLGWEGVGLCSYLLVSFWYTRISANKAAIKALVINRIGDLGLLLAMALIYNHFKTLEYAVLFSVIEYYQYIYINYFGIKFHLLTLIGICLFIGAVGKSAQLGLHTWLPDAMEGPTPVSALIHAATMVTAGVFLIIRCSPLFECTPTLLVFIVFIGSITSFFASSIGLFQVDIKKIIAYSTCSQLGYMVVACGLSNYVFALYHLLTHACFKALLFLSAGSIIHSVHDEQDFRKMGGLRFFLPLTYSVMVIGSLAIMGFPFLAGFYSKDLIIESNFINGTVISYGLQLILIISTIMTIFYSTKLLYYVFIETPNGAKYVYETIHESSVKSFLMLPLIILAILSIFIGYLFEEIFTPVGNIFFNNVIFTANMVIIENLGSLFLSFPLYLTLFFTFICVYYFFIITLMDEKIWSNIQEERGQVRWSVYMSLLTSYETFRNKMPTDYLLLEEFLVVLWKGERHHLHNIRYQYISEKCFNISNRLYKYLRFILKYSLYIKYFMFGYKIAFFARINPLLNKFFSKKWYFDLFQNIFIAYPIIVKINEIFYLTYEKGFFEFFGPNGFTKGSVWVSSYFIKNYQKNNINLLIFSMVSFLLIFFFSYLYI